MRAVASLTDQEIEILKRDCQTPGLFNAFMIVIMPKLPIIRRMSRLINCAQPRKNRPQPPACQCGF